MSQINTVNLKNDYILSIKLYQPYGHKFLNVAIKPAGLRNVATKPAGSRTAAIKPAGLRNAATKEAAKCQACLLQAGGYHTVQLISPVFPLI